MVLQTPLKRAQLDFYLVSEELMAIVDKTDIKQGYRTDHNICEIVHACFYALRYTSYIQICFHELQIN